MAILRFEHVAKSLPHGFWLRRRPVLRDVNLEVYAGEVYGFLGPNGSGKTTSVKCLLGLLRVDAGVIEIFGEPGAGATARQRLGYLPEQPYFYPHLTGRELLDYFARLFGLDVVERARRSRRFLELVGLAAEADTPISQYSKGMLQRIGLAQALINEPELVVLDEPMSGLDPIGRREIKDIIIALRERGTTVFFSSHILADAEALCDRVGLLFDGRILRQSSMEDLLEDKVQYWEVASEGVAAEKLGGYLPSAVEGERLYFRLQEEQAVDHLMQTVLGVGGRVVSLVPHRVTLEQFFLETVRSEQIADASDDVPDQLQARAAMRSRTSQGGDR